MGRWALTTDRLALNDDDARVRRWFIDQTEALGCSVTVRLGMLVTD
jgi:hypothetical protein